MATSEAYGSKAAAMGGIRSVQSLAGDAAIEDQTTKEWSAAEAARKAAASAKKLTLTLRPRRQEGLRPGRAPETLLKG